jgi:cytoskeletal protein RodZ
MSLTLGEKLRQARESRGITISEVAEQTRISGLYLESIENNDYRGLPGGIFNKGFVKSYAKYVGIDEQEALRDYAQLISEQGEDRIDETRTYRPEVLTDDRSTGSMIPTLIFAAIILGLLTWGVISLVNYLNTPKDPAANSNTANSNKNGNSAGNSNNGNSGNTTPPPMPASNEIKVELKPLVDKINVTATVDGKVAAADVTSAAPATYTGKESVKISYYKGFTPDKIQLTINGKVITTPAAPANPKRQSIEFEINKENIQQIWQSGAITLGTPAPPNANANPATGTNTAPR